MVYDRIEDSSLRLPDLFVCPKPGFKPAEMSKLSNIIEHPWHSQNTLWGTDKVKKRTQVLKMVTKHFGCFGAPVIKAYVFTTVA